MYITLLKPVILLMTFAYVFLLVKNLVGILMQYILEYKEKYLSRAETNLDDMYATLQPDQLIVINISSVVIGAILASTLIHFFAFPIGALVGYILPQILLSMAKRKRLDKFDSQLVDGMTLIANAMKAGNSLLQAMDRLVDQMPPPISQEFRLLLSEVKIGVALDEAFLNMVDRLKSDQFNIVVTSIIISRKTGGNLAEAFNKISNTIRERDKVQGKLNSLTAQGKLQGIIVGALPILVGGAFCVISPDFMEPLFTTLIGRTVIVVIVVLEIIGGVVIKRIVEIDI